MAGLLGSGLVAPALAVVGLLVVALVTLDLMNGDLPFRGGGPNGPGNGPDRTPAPSNVVIPEPEAVFPGSIVYVKSGNIWVQTGTDARQLTSSGQDSMPSWSPDGEWIYYIESEPAIGYWPVRGRPGRYDMIVPHLMRVPPDGSAPPEELVDGRIRDGELEWFFWMRQPVVRPGGSTIALVTDAPNPERSDVVLQLYDPERDRFSRTDVPETAPLGHQDPSWRPDGRYLLYVRNGREGSRGAPAIWRYDPEEKKARVVSAAGYLNPDYSPDGRFIAATRTSSLGNDVVILDGSRGTELLRLTTDGRAWAPVWSPAGDAIAFLHMDGQSVDLWMARLSGTAPSWTVEEIVELTVVSGLEAASRPDWYVPPDELPETPPPATPSASGSAAPGSVAP